MTLDQQFPPMTVDMQDHRWTTFDNPRGVFSKKIFETGGFATVRGPVADFLDFRRKHLQEGCMVTFNVNIDQLGNVNPRSEELRDK